MPKKEMTARDEADFILMSIMLTGIMSKVSLPEGWVYEIKSDCNDFFLRSTKEAILELRDRSEDPTIRIEARGPTDIHCVEKLLVNRGLMKQEDAQIDPEDKYFKWEYDEYSSVFSGHVHFKTEKGWFTYDRRGVDDSFYIYAGDFSKDDWGLGENITKFTERITKSRDNQSRSVAVPGIPFSVNPEQKEQITAKLKAGKHHSFHPSGFGTGYHIMAKRRDRYSTPNSEAAKFFGVPQIYVSTFDCD